MAYAKKNVERKVTEEVTYTLTLTHEEAETLRAVMANVAGSSEVSKRKHVDAIYDALYKTGAKFKTGKELGLSGTIRFADDATMATTPVAGGKSFTEALYRESNLYPRSY